MDEKTYQGLLRWTSLWTRWTGLGGMFFTLLFWAITDRFQAPFLMMFGSMAGASIGFDVLKDISSHKHASRAMMMSAEEELATLSRGKEDEVSEKEQ